jgi:flavin reductase (DIM6/NTAB) family NADH-FMN oxidoreductase RutF
VDAFFVSGYQSYFSSCLAFQEWNRKSTMTRQTIPIEKLVVKPQYLWNTQNLVLTSGDFSQGSFNAMTIGWGSFGVMWGIPFVQVVVRPIRYTYEFMERYDIFTVCAFPVKFAQAIQILGSRSGRDGDKIAEAGLTPIRSTKVAAPSYAEAELVLECRKIYWDDMKNTHFLDTQIEKKYPRKDYHRIYYGEIVAVLGERQYEA